MASRPKRSMLKVREDLFYRLRWNIFAPLDEIEIRTGPCDSTTDTPLFSHHLANEPITNPPLSRIDEVCIRECWDRVDYRYEEAFRYKPPPSLAISNEDSSPITLGQFVTEVHAYINLHAEELKAAKAELYGIVTEDDPTSRVVTFGDHYLPPNIRFFFWNVCGVQIGQKSVLFSARFFAEGERFETAEQFWDKQLRCAQNLEQLREEGPVAKY